MPAFACACYTISTINNSFDTNIDPMIGLLDSHVSISILKVTKTFEGNESHFIDWTTRHNLTLEPLRQLSASSLPADCMLTLFFRWGDEYRLTTLV